MLDAESQRAKNLTAIAADYSQLPPVSRFVVWLVVLLIKQRARKPLNKVNLIVGSVGKLIDQ